MLFFIRFLYLVFYSAKVQKKIVAAKKLENKVNLHSYFLHYNLTVMLYLYQHNTVGSHSKLLHR